MAQFEIAVTRMVEEFFEHWTQKSLTLGGLGKKQKRTQLLMIRVRMRLCGHWRRLWGRWRVLEVWRWRGVAGENA